MGKSFYPDAWAVSAFDIDYQKMYDRGFRGIIYDIDNTLVYPNAPADERAAALFQRLRDIGFRTVILSNNTGKRALTFAEQVASPAVTGALKPFPGRYRDAVTKMGIRPQYLGREQRGALLYPHTAFNRQGRVLDPVEAPSGKAGDHENQKDTWRAAEAGRNACRKYLNPGSAGRHACAA